MALEHAWLFLKASPITNDDEDDDVYEPTAAEGLENSLNRILADKDNPWRCSNCGMTREEDLRHFDGNRMSDGTPTIIPITAKQQACMDTGHTQGETSEDSNWIRDGEE